MKCGRHGNVDMTHTFNCSYCDQKLEAENEWAGEVFDCPNCGKSLTVPRPHGEFAQRVPLPSTPPKKKHTLLRSVAIGYGCIVAVALGILLLRALMPESNMKQRTLAAWQAFQDAENRVSGKEYTSPR